MTAAIAFLATPLGRRLAAAGAAIVVALGLVLWVQGLRSALASETAAKEQAVAATARLSEQLALQQKNAALAGMLAARSADRERTRGSKVTAVQEDVRHAKAPIPAQCRPMLAPLSRAFDGVRSLQAERDGGASASRSLVRSGSAGAAGS